MGEHTVDKRGILKEGLKYLIFLEAQNPKCIRCLLVCLIALDKQMSEEA